MLHDHTGFPEQVASGPSSMTAAQSAIDKKHSCIEEARGEPELPSGSECFLQELAQASERPQPTFFCASSFLPCPPHPNFFPKITSFWDIKSTLCSNLQGLGLGDGFWTGSPDRKKQLWRARKGG